MKSLEKISYIDKSKLNGEHYFQSLLEQAYLQAMLSEEEVQHIQRDCFDLLAKVSQRSSGGSSSSIRIEVAESIFTSIMFTIGFYLKSFPCPDDAVHFVKDGDLNEIFQRGRKQIDQAVRKAKLFHMHMLPNLINTKNEFYASTVVDGIKGFFKLYDSDFMAQEIHITVDYPAYNTVEERTGIEFIQEYMDRINYENLFCSYFETEDIHQLLRGFDQGYEALLFNLYEPVLAAALGLIIVGEDVKKLKLTEKNQKSLYSIFVGKDVTEIQDILLESATGLSKEMMLSEALTHYMEDSLPKLAREIKHSVGLNHLDRVFILAEQ